MASKRILCLLADVGGAHRAIAGVLRESLQSECEVEVVDLFKATSRFCAASVGLYSPVLRGFPRFYNFFYDASASRGGWSLIYNLFIRRLMRAKTAGIILARRPDAVVSVSAITSRIAAEAIGDSGLGGKVPLVVFVIDPFTIHRAWIEPRSRLMLVPSQAGKAALLARKVDEGIIRVVRYPVRAGFGKTGDRPGLRRVYGVVDGGPVALVMGGGDGVLSVDRISTSLLEADCSLNVVAAAGRNARLRGKLEDAAPSWHGRLIVVGDSGRVHELMAMADVVITKPGPSTIMEAIESELPIILTGFVPRQERGNVDYVLDRGLGVYLSERNIRAACRLAVDREWLGRVRASMRHEKSGFPELLGADTVRALLDGHDEAGLGQVS